MEAAVQQAGTPYSDQIWDEVELWSRDRIVAFQTDAMKKQLARVAQKSAHYGKVFDDCGFDPGDFRELADIRKLPLTRKTDYVKGLAEDPPFGSFRAVEAADAVRIHRHAGIDASRLLSRMPSSRRALRSLDHHIFNRVIIEYVEWNPSRTLRAIRWARARHVRSFADDCCFERRLAAARAHEKMNKLRAALSLYRSAYEMFDGDATCRAAIRRLEKLYPNRR